MTLLKTRHPVISQVMRFIMILIGSVMAALALEMFLIPNNVIDGGVVGISIMASHLTKIPLGIFTFVLNLPFLYIGYKQIGKSFVIHTLFAIAAFSFFVTIFHPIEEFTQDTILAVVFGGIILGAGVGIIIRCGGSLDGTEMIAIILSKNSWVSIGMVIVFFNVFILGASGLLFGFDRAMYSLVTYFIAFKVIDIVVEGIDEAKAAMIVSASSDEIASAIIARLGRSVTFLDGEGGYQHERQKVLYVVVTRLEIAKLKEIIKLVDEHAFMTLHNVSDVINLKKQKIH